MSLASEGSQADEWRFYESQYLEANGNGVSDQRSVADRNERADQCATEAK